MEKPREAARDVPGAIARLVELLKDRDVAVRIAAARQLGELGRGAEAALPALLEALADGEEHTLYVFWDDRATTPVRLAVAEALAKINAAGNSPKRVVSAGPGMGTSAKGEDPAYIVTTDLTTDLDGYGFSLMRFRGEDVLELMVEDQTNCYLGQSQLSAQLFRDRLEVAVAEDAVADLGIPTDYLISFSADDERLRAMDATLQVICAGIARYSRQF
jgi:hypothetical protein